MGLTDNTKQLIQAISENNIQAARRCAIACLSEDTTAKNASFVTRYKPILQRSSSVIELPANLKYKVEALDMTEIFREDRYYLSPNNAEIVDEIIKMKEASEELAVLQIPFKNATLLYGETGTGKTTLAKYVAYKLKLPYLYLNFSHVIDSHMGKTSTSLNHIFEYVRRTPCVFVIDEIDAIAIRRSNSSDQGCDGEMNRITITLMQEIDNLPNDVIIIAATNRMDRIDEALLSRFTQKRELAVPDSFEKHAIVDKYISTIPDDMINPEYINKACKKRTQRDIINSLVKGIASAIIDRKNDPNPKLIQ